MKRPAAGLMGKRGWTWEIIVVDTDENGNRRERIFDDIKENEQDEIRDRVTARFLKGAGYAPVREA